MGDQYSVFVGGNQVTYTVTGADTSIDTIAANLVAAIAAPLTLDLSLMTQFDGDFTAFSFERNGFAKATIVSLSFDGVGHISGNFDDATNRRIYKVPFAVFSNPNGLEMKSGNVFAETPNSGTARIEDASSDGFARFQVNTRDLGNVNLVDEFSRMIQVQNAYNSSATAFRTVDEMLVTARDLAR